MNHTQRYARKQVLLTRIAFERSTIRLELAQVHRATSLSNLLGLAVGGNLASALFSAGTAREKGWLGLTLSLLRRYRGTAMLLGSALPMLGGRRGWRRVVTVAAIGAAAWLGWRAWRGRSTPP